MHKTICLMKCPIVYLRHTIMIHRNKILEMYQVLLDNIIYNMSALVQTDKYGTMNTTYTTTIATV